MLLPSWLLLLLLTSFLNWNLLSSCFPGKSSQLYFTSLLSQPCPAIIVELVPIRHRHVCVFLGRNNPLCLRGHTIFVSRLHVVMMLDMVAFGEGPCLHNQIHLGMRLSQQQTKGKIDTQLSSYLGFPFPPLLPLL